MVATGQVPIGLVEAQVHRHQEPLFDRHVLAGGDVELVV